MEPDESKEQKKKEYPIIDIAVFKTNLKRFLSFLKENLSIIILVPTVFGGIWQLYELSQISISYIRFFSLTQMVPDGLTVLVFLAIISFLFFGLYNMISKPEESVGYRYLDLTHKNSPKKTAIVILLFVVVGFISTYKMYMSVSKLDNVVQFFPVLVIGMGAVFIVTAIMSTILTHFKLYDKHTLTMFKFFFTFPFLVYSVMFIYHLKNYLQIPRDLINIHNVENQDFNKGTRILYYNDKYVFTQEFDLEKFEKTKEYKLKNRVISIDKLISDDKAEITPPKNYLFRVRKAFKDIDNREQLKHLTSDYKDVTK